MDEVIDLPLTSPPPNEPEVGDIVDLPTPLDTSEITRLIECLLFVSRSPLTIKELARYCGADRAVVRQILEDLQDSYAHSGLQVINIADGYQMGTREEYAEQVKKVIHKPEEVNLSNAAIETLAIIAYRQPVTKGDIEYIRGTNSDYIVNTLEEKTLIRELGTAEKIGRPMTYGTTEVFLKVFGLQSIKDLPPSPYTILPNEC